MPHGLRRYVCFSSSPLRPGQPGLRPAAAGSRVDQADRGHLRPMAPDGQQSGDRRTGRQGDHPDSQGPGRIPRSDPSPGRARLPISERSARGAPPDGRKVVAETDQGRNQQVRARARTIDRNAHDRTIKWTQTGIAASGCDPVPTTVYASTQNSLVRPAQALPPEARGSASHPVGRRGPPLVPRPWQSRLRTIARRGRCMSQGPRRRGADSGTMSRRLAKPVTGMKTGEQMRMPDGDVAPLTC